MKLGFVICVALASAACKDHELAALKAVRDEVCACKTVACAETALTKVPKKDVRSGARSSAVAREMLHCLSDLHTAELPTMDPDAPTRP